MRLALGIALALGLGFWFARHVDVAAVAASLGDLHVAWVAAAALFQISALTVRGWRWRSLLSRGGRVPLGAALAATFMGWVALVLVPARLGELARPWLLGRRLRFDRSFAFGAQQLERLLDLAVLLASVGLYLAFGPEPVGIGGGDELRGALETAQRLLLTLVIIVLAGLTLAVALAPRLEAWLMRRFGGRWQSTRGARWPRRMLSFAHGLTAIRSGRLLAVSSAQSLLLWLFVGATHASLFRAFDLALPLLAIPPVMTFVVVGALVPAPVAVGSYHKAVQAVLTSLLGVPLAVATGYALVGHLVAYLPNLAIGTTLLAHEGVSISELSGGAPAEPSGSVVE